MENLVITELIPQQMPFVFVDRLISHEPKTAKTTFLVKDNGIFIENNELQESGIMENIAQSCAANMGFISKYLKNEKIRIGVIGNIKNLTIYHLPKVGSLLETFLNDLYEDFEDIKIFEAKVQCGQTIIATCEIKVALLNA